MQYILHGRVFVMKRDEHMLSALILPITALTLTCYGCLKCNDPFKKDTSETIECSGVCVRAKASTDVVNY